MTERKTDEHHAPVRFFFSTARDLYFLTYTIAVIISQTQTSKGGFVDARKLPFLVPFVSDARLTDIARRRHEGLPVSFDDRVRLHNAETQGRRLRPLVHRLIFSLVRQGHLEIEGLSPSEMQLRVPKGSVLHKLAKDRLFKYERQNIMKLRSLIKLRLALLPALRERLFLATEEL